MRILEEALTFDDVLLVPAYSEILPREVDLSTRVTRRIRLNLPLMSAAMDTVTEARLAITIAQEGGIGVIHKSMTIEAQAQEVGRVKKFESGVIKDPITVSPNMSIREVLDLTRSRGISGVPVVVGKKAVGIVTHRDLRFEDKLDAPVSTVMTPKERLVTVRENAPKEDVLALLHKHRIEKVLVVNSDHDLVVMITVKDFQKATEFPRACKDEVLHPIRSIASRRYAKPGLIWSWSTQPTVIPRASSRWSSGSRPSGPISRSLPAISPHPKPHAPS